MRFRSFSEWRARRRAGKALLRTFGTGWKSVPVMKQTSADVQRFGEWLASARSPEAALDALREEVAAESGSAEECAARLKNIARAFEAVEGTKGSGILNS